MENAIRYGARARSEGYVLITTRREDGGVTISISDNGKGFDPSTAVADSTRSMVARSIIRCEGSRIFSARVGKSKEKIESLPHSVLFFSVRETQTIANASVTPLI